MKLIFMIHNALRARNKLPIKYIIIWYSVQS